MTTSRRKFLGTGAALSLAPFAASIMAQTTEKNMSTASTPAHLSASPAGPFSTQPWNADHRVDMGAYSVERVTFLCDGIEIVGNLFIPAGAGGLHKRAGAHAVCKPPCQRGLCNAYL